MDYKNSLNKSLRDLLKNTPSGRMKLLAAWDGLSTETQIKTLNLLGSNLSIEVAEKALLSENAYVRYLAAKNIYLDKNKLQARELLEKIESDSSLLVKYVDEEKISFHETEESFYAKPQEKKLALLRGSSAPNGKDFSTLITYGIKNKKFNDNELNDLLIEYFCNPAISNYFTASYIYDGHDDKHKEYFKALWELIFILPSDHAALILLQHIPICVHLTLWMEIDSILQSIKPSLLSNLLDRDDIQVIDIHHELFSKMIEEKLWGVIDVIAHSQGTRLVYYQAAEDLLKTNPLNKLGAVYKYNEAYIRWPVKRSCFIKLPYSERRSQLYELAIYEMAKSAIKRQRRNELAKRKPDADTGLPENFQFLADKIISNDAWATFMSFLEQLNDMTISNNAALLFSYLPTEYRKLIPMPPSDPSELFGLEGREANFLEDKIDYIGKELIKLNEHLVEKEQGFNEIVQLIVSLSLFLLIFFGVVFLISKAIKYLF